MGGHGIKGRSGPPANRNREEHGHYRRVRELKQRGLKAIDGRTVEGLDVRAFGAGLVEHLGGEVHVTATKQEVVELAMVNRWLRREIQRFMATLPTLINRKKRTMAPIVREWMALANQQADLMVKLGLGAVRVETDITLSEYLQTRTSTTAADAAQAHENGSGSSNAEQGDAEVVPAQEGAE